MKNVLSRLCRLEAMRPEPLTVLCKLPTGEETVLTVDECIRQRGDFLRVKTRNNLGDVDKLLNYITGEICVIN